MRKSLSTLYAPLSGTPSALMSGSALTLRRVTSKARRRNVMSREQQLHKALAIAGIIFAALILGLQVGMYGAHLLHPGDRHSLPVEQNVYFVDPPDGRVVKTFLPAAGALEAEETQPDMGLPEAPVKEFQEAASFFPANGGDADNIHNAGGSHIQSPETAGSAIPSPWAELAARNGFGVLGAPANGAAVKPASVPAAPAAHQLVRAGGLEGQVAKVPAAIAFDPGASSRGPIETFLAAGHHLPVALLTCCRAELLAQTLTSLAAARGYRAADVVVLQDGHDAAVADVVRRRGLELVQHDQAPIAKKWGAKSLTKAAEGAVHIAAHYSFALGEAFRRRPEAPAILVVEDDMLFSPDFLEYFEHNAPVVERDRTIRCLSAWNDNGFRGKAIHPGELRRTDFFPGLGWMLTREMWENELAARWPPTHWDHWMREEEQRKGRECVYPEVPRVFHNGAKGTFMNQKTHDRLFKDIAHNLDPSFHWQPDPITRFPAYAAVLKDNYEAQVLAWLAAALHTTDVDAAADTASGEVALWYSVRPRGPKDRPNQNPPFKALADIFGLWHENERTAHNGMMHFHRGEAHVMLINHATSTYVSHMPGHIIPLDLAAAGRSLAGKKRLPPVLSPAEQARLDSAAASAVLVPTERYGQSCDEACAGAGTNGALPRRCEPLLLGRINNCKDLLDHFGCTRCSENFGYEQPAFVNPAAPKDKNPGDCLVSNKPEKSTCGASHQLTRRLCPCVPLAA